MNEEHTKYLVEKYPRLWQSIRFGQFECGDGWFDLIDTLSRVLGEKARCEDFVIVKEKFGGLRVQGLVSDEQDKNYMWGAITMAETMSYRICERCGKPGKKRPGGWIQTLCDECEEKKKE